MLAQVGNRQTENLAKIDHERVAAFAGVHECAQHVQPFAAPTTGIQHPGR
jgi:hypothetical protein